MHAVARLFGRSALMALLVLVLSIGMAARGDSVYVDSPPANAVEPLFTVTFDGTLKSVDLQGQTTCEIPPFVRSIARTAFTGCTELVTLTIPSTVTNIECSWAGPRPRYSLIDISAMNDLMVWAESTYSPFSGCVNLRDVRVSQYVCDIGLPIVFGDAREGITNVVFDSSVTNIGTWTIETARTAYSWYADNKPFERIGCSNILCVTFSSNVNMTRDRVLQPDSLQPIIWAEPRGMFDNSRLERVVFLDGVTRICDGAFDACGNLVDVSIPDSLQEIGQEAFSACSNLVAVTIPGSVTNIGDWAFAACHRLSSVLFKGDAPIANPSVFGVVPEGSIVPLRFMRQDLSVGEMCSAFVMVGSTGWDVDIPGGWNGIQIDYFRPILPQVLFDTDISSAKSVVTDFTDPNVATYAVSDVGTYQEYRVWADSVGVENVAASPTAWMSFALGSPTLLSAPEQGDLKIDDIKPSADRRSVSMLFSLDGVDVADTEAVVSRLDTVFEVQGAEELGELQPVAPVFEVEEGKVKVTVTPPAGADSYFMKVKMK